MEMLNYFEHCNFALVCVLQIQFPNFSSWPFHNMASIYVGYFFPVLLFIKWFQFFIMDIILAGIMRFCQMVGKVKRTSSLAKGITY